MKLLEFKFLLPLISNTKKCSSKTPSYYVGRIKIQDYWSQNCGELKKMYSKGKFIVLLDDEPILQNVESNEGLRVKLVKFDYEEIMAKFNEYGLKMVNDNTVLLDVLPPEKKGFDYKPLIGVSVPLKKPEPISGINFNEIKKELAKDLGGYCLSTIICRWILESDIERDYLTKFESIFKWHKTYSKCPNCGDFLIKKLSKVSCICSNCNQMFYPTVIPISVTFIVDKSNKYCLLVNPLNSLKNIFTLIHSFSNPGETLKECGKRGIAKRIGIECNNLQLINNFQSYPSINNSLLSAFYCVLDKEIKIDDPFNPIKCSKWFSREEIKDIINTTYDNSLSKNFSLSMVDSILSKKKIGSDNNYYIPPPGSLSHTLIKMWAEDPNVFTK
uniref:Nudix hydrolase domain-containing protein n=1 Tax=Strongyloides stercoralis TaxID=6248 RepID=A0A0K0E6J6_STRER